MFAHTCVGTWLKGPYLASKGPQRTEDVSAKGKRREDKKAMGRSTAGPTAARNLWPALQPLW